MTLTPLRLSDIGVGLWTLGNLSKTSLTILRVGSIFDIYCRSKNNSLTNKKQICQLMLVPSCCISRKIPDSVLGYERAGVGPGCFERVYKQHGIKRGSWRYQTSDTTMHYFDACKKNKNDIGSMDCGYLMVRTTDLSLAKEQKSFLEV